MIFGSAQHFQELSTSEACSVIAQFPILQDLNAFLLQVT
jgi:hypothetical protein